MMKINLPSMCKTPIFVIGLSFILGIATTNIYFYQKGLHQNIQQTKPIQKLSFVISTPKQKPLKESPFNPVMEKPKFYMGSIQGTLTYDHAIKIAQDYYQKGAYENAIIWAYRANQINPNDIQSWKIYTQSLSKIGQEKQAEALMQQAQIFFKTVSK